MNKLTNIFEPTPYIKLYTKETLIKAKTETSDCIVTRNIPLSQNSKRQIVHPMNQPMTSNIPDTATMIITITITGAIL